MHQNPAFRNVSNDSNLAFARARGFGVIAINAEDGPAFSHVPFLLSADGTKVDMHMTRSNPVYRLLAEGKVPARLAVSGADSYISPDWYGIADQVPTWNYVAVHLSGALERLPEEHLLSHLQELSTHFETQLLPKPIWQTSKVAPEVLARMMRMVAPVRLHVNDVQATWKLAQNKDEQARLAASAGLKASGIEGAFALVSDLMVELPDATD